jgi:hypothetical protein
VKSHVLGFALLSITAIVANAPAQAQNGSLTRSFVSSSGVDTNPCTITQPCATFAHAYTMVGANGIIAALDPGKYGPVSITGPVTINGNGWAAITGTSGNNAIAITAASGNVTLTGLELDGAGAGLHGIFLTSPLSANATLNIRDCVVSNFLDSGIAIQPASSNAVDFDLFITNTSSLNNGLNGIVILPTGGGALVRGAITGTTVANNAHNGFDLEEIVAMTIANSVATNNTVDGIYDAVSAVGPIIIQDTISTFNGVDFNASTNIDTYLYHDTFYVFNGTGAAGSLFSDGTNRIILNSGNNLPTKQSTD